MPLAESRGSASGGVWGNAPTAPRATSMPNVSNKRRRQRSVPASNFARPQTRPQLALFNIYAVSRQMGATEQMVFQTQSIFSASRGISPLLRRPKGNENRRTSAIARWKPSGAPPCYLVFNGDKVTGGSNHPYRQCSAQMCAGKFRKSAVFASAHPICAQSAHTAF